MLRCTTGTSLRRALTKLSEAVLAGLRRAVAGSTRSTTRRQRRQKKLLAIFVASFPTSLDAPACGDAAENHRLIPGPGKAPGRQILGKARATQRVGQSRPMTPEQYVQQKPLPRAAASITPSFRPRPGAQAAQRSPRSMRFAAKWMTWWTKCLTPAWPAPNWPGGRPKWPRPLAASPPGHAGADAACPRLRN